MGGRVVKLVLPPRFARTGGPGHGDKFRRTIHSDYGNSHKRPRQAQAYIHDRLALKRRREGSGDSEDHHGTAYSAASASSPSSSSSLAPSASEKEGALWLGCCCV